MTPQPLLVSIARHTSLSLRARMITFLRVRNLAIVDEFAIEPGPGLNVLTGETGAGKSLLIDSLEFISGARSSSELVRTGTDRMSAEAIFQLDASAAEELDARGVEFSSSGDGLEVIVKRELSSTGRGRALAGGSPVSVRELTELVEPVLEIHGQNESRGRIAGKNFLQILDVFADASTLSEETTASYRRWRMASETLERLRESVRDRALRVDLLKYQIDEIGAASLDATEEEQLRQERAVLQHAQEVIAGAAGAYAVLEDEEGSALEQISRAAQLLHPLEKNIAEIAQIAADLEDARYRLREVAHNIGRLAENVRPDPERLDEIEQRLATIERLKKKYGGSIEAVLIHFETVSAEYDRLSDHETHLAKLETEEHSAFREYEKAASDLSSRRKKVAPQLQKAIVDELDDLAMERAVVEIRLTRAVAADSRFILDGEGVAFGESGFDRVEILFSPNRGEDPKPLQKIASGGELSRIQLAIATAVFRRQQKAASSTLVFDEIDAGVGGRVAEAVGMKLRELAAKHQVLCVTHLPQIASLGQTHFRVWKEDAGGKTRARIEALTTQSQRVEEIARMLAGEEVSESARAHATQLLTAGTASPATGRRRKASA